MEAKTRADAQSPGRWFRRFDTRAGARRRLLCFHHAGGGPSLFRDWHRHCPTDTEVWAVALPGRETRITERPLDQLRVLAGLLAEVLPVDLPFAFFGHSLGGIVAFELARQLHERGLPVPEHLFVSACFAPHLCRRDTSRATLSNAELVRLLEDFGGTPKAVLGHRGYLEMVLPVLRADFSLVDGYLLPEDCGARFPITAYAGSSDAHVQLDKVLAWDRWAMPGFACREFDGGHFYLVEQRAALIEDLLARWGRQDHRCRHAPSSGSVHERTTR